MLEFAKVKKGRKSGLNCWPSTTNNQMSNSIFFFNSQQPEAWKASNPHGKRTYWHSTDFSSLISLNKDLYPIFLDSTFQHIYFSNIWISFISFDILSLMQIQECLLKSLSQIHQISFCCIISLLQENHFS